MRSSHSGGPDTARRPAHERRWFIGASRLLLGLAWPLVCLAGQARAQVTPPSVRALRLAGGEGSAVKVDGRLDEAAWKDAPAATGLRQREPREGDGASEDTEVRVLYDAEHLYVGVLARDREPARVIGRILQRDRLMEMDFAGPRFAGDDAVALFFDPFHDHRNAVVFATNPNGAEYDALITDEGKEFNVDWRGVWRVASARTAEGWSAEFEIPFRTLRYPRGGGPEPWGFNVARMIRRRNEETLWTAWARGSEGITRVSRFGHLEGLADLPTGGLNLEVKPFALSGATDERLDDTVDEGATIDAGLDAKYELRPGLVLDVTVNPDFAQVEADDEQVNLTRFDLFFPEKRDFFLENAGIFEFGWRSFGEPPPFLLFFSRQIGIGDDIEVPVLGGVRLTGRAGAQTVGLLGMMTGPAEGEPRTRFSALRVKRDVRGSSYVGAMLTDRRGGGMANSAAGVDATFWAGDRLKLEGMAAATRSTGPSDDDPAAALRTGSAYRLSADYQADRFGFQLQHLTVGPDVEAEMGFVTRTDMRRTDLFARASPRPHVLGLRKLEFFWFAQHIAGVDGRLQDWSTGPAISPEWESGEALMLFGQVGFTRLDEAFDLTDEVWVQPGDYDVRQLGWFANTSRARPWSLSSISMVQWIYDGKLSSIGGTLSVAATSHATVTAGYTWNDVRVPDGAFRADIASLRLGYAFSTRWFVNALLQYNGLDDEVSANVRLNFVHRPGSDLFLVLSEERGSEGSLWRLGQRTVVAKLTYLARL